MSKLGEMPSSKNTQATEKNEGKKEDLKTFDRKGFYVADVVDIHSGEGIGISQLESSHLGEPIILKKDLIIKLKDGSSIKIPKGSKFGVNSFSDSMTRYKKYFTLYDLDKE